MSTTEEDIRGGGGEEATDVILVMFYPNLSGPCLENCYLKGHREPSVY